MLEIKSMVYCGIDLGSRFTKIVLIGSDQSILFKNILPTSYDQLKDLSQYLNAVGFKNNNIPEDKIPVCITGAGKSLYDLRYHKLTDNIAIATAVRHLYPSVRTVIDIGAESSSVIKIDSLGRVTNIINNDRCSSGTGVFLETISKILELPLNKIDECYFLSKNKVSLNSQCTVFAESEVISLIHSGVEKNDIVRSIIDSIAEKILILTKKVGVEDDILIIGGLSHYLSLKNSLKEFLNTKNLFSSELSRFINAYGCAIYLLNRVDKRDD